MECNYDLNIAKNMKFSIKNNLFIVENDEKVFVFIIFRNKITDKTSLLFRELNGTKMNLEDIVLIQNIINNFQEYFDSCDGYNGNI